MGYHSQGKDAIRWMKNIVFIGVLTMGFVIPSFAEYDEVTKPEDEYKRPIGCNNTGYFYNLNAITLKPQEVSVNRQYMYFIFNTRSEPLHLYQMRRADSSRSLYMNHTIAPHQWAVLSTNELQLEFICAVSGTKSRYDRVVFCGQSTVICQDTGVRYGLNNKGSYWLVDSNTKNGALRQVVYYGIIP